MVKVEALSVPDSDGRVVKSGRTILLRSTRAVQIACSVHAGQMV